MGAIEQLLVQLDAKVQAGEIQSLLPDGPERAERVLTAAIDAFSRFHSRRALSFEDWRILVDPRLSLYYGNRLAGMGLDIGSEA